ncbi:MAG: chemotaxis protein CheB [Sphingobacteriaceae bacterium]
MNCELLVIGGSAGSLEVIMSILPDLRADLPFAIIIVMHRNNQPDSTLHELLSAKTILKVKEAEDKEAIFPGVIYLAPPDYHLLIEKDKTLSLDHFEKVNYSRPSIDLTFITAGEAFGESVAALLLSGANADGVNGLEVIKNGGGMILVQNPETARVPYMPNYAIESLTIDMVLTPQDMANFINNMLNN